MHAVPDDGLNVLLADRRDALRQTTTRVALDPIPVGDAATGLAQAAPQGTSVLQREGEDGLTIVARPCVRQGHHSDPWGFGWG
jgi:hypothetical protein